jgi:hypothetical protein
MKQLYLLHLRYAFLGTGSKSLVSYTSTLRTREGKAFTEII